MCEDVLRQLAIEAQKYPPLSPQRQQVLNRLINKILKSDALGHPQHGGYHPSYYEDIRNEALQITLLQVCQKIDAYNPAHPVMAWVNFMLNMKFKDVMTSYNRRGLTFIPRSKLGQVMQIPSLDDLDRDVGVEEKQTNAQLLQQFLEKDPEGLLQNEHVRNRPEVTFQRVALTKYVEDQTWEEMAQNFDISLQTLYSFFDRRLQKFMPYFKKYLQE